MEKCSNTEAGKQLEKPLVRYVRAGSNLEIASQTAIEDWYMTYQNTYRDRNTHSVRTDIYSALFSSVTEIFSPFGISATVSMTSNMSSVAEKVSSASVTNQHISSHNEPCMLKVL
jgi:hypothetical protein